MDGITDSMDMNLSKLREMGRTEEPGVPQSMGLQRVGPNLATDQQDFLRATKAERQDKDGKL